MYLLQIFTIRKKSQHKILNLCCILINLETIEILIKLYEAKLLEAKHYFIKLS